MVIARNRLTEKHKRGDLAQAQPRLSSATWKLAEHYLTTEQWSPEQISGYLKLHTLRAVSTEQIYQHILADKRAGGNLYQHLRSQKKWRTRYSKNSKRRQIPNRRSIEERPAVAPQNLARAI